MLLSLLIFLFPLAYSPGPGNMFFAANGARFGFRATLRANLGYHLATWLVTAAIGLGAYGILAQQPALFQVLKFIGAGYVFYLAWKFLRAGAFNPDLTARVAGFWDGVILLMLNPKAYVIIALMFTQFLGTEVALTQVVLITTVFTLNNLFAFSLWTLVGAQMAALFQRADRELNIGFGVMLALIALWMLLA